MNTFICIHRYFYIFQDANFTALLCNVMRNICIRNVVSNVNIIRNLPTGSLVKTFRYLAINAQRALSNLKLIGTVKN